MELAQGPRSFDELKTSIQVESSSIKQCITNQIRQHEENLAHKNYRQRFLDSLWYPEIYSRQERVAEAHQATFQWVYEPDGFNELARRWYNIVHWLEKDSGIYWISGKAGSGKSTLMNFIHQDDRTSTLLGVWAGGKKVLTPGYFFWNAGTTLEKSFQGLLRSLLYQILLKAPDLTPTSVDSNLFESHSPRFDTDGVQNGEPFAAWTERRLRTTFQGVMRQAKGKCHICIFIDGLDEISGDPEAIIAGVEDMQSADVKVCLSSRPDRSYVEAFRSCAMLRLQDLTEPDIRTYVLDKLQPFLSTELPYEVSCIMDSLVDKAQGVFLWVELVVKTLIKGLKNKDSMEQLRTRVESLPSDVEALYAKMLSNIDVAYHKIAAQLLHMALADLTGSVLETALALHRLSDPSSEISIGDALDNSFLTQEKIPDICAGLLEVHLEDEDSEQGGGNIKLWDGYLSLPTRYTSSPETAKVSFQERYAHVEFIHRTAADFLRQSKQGQDFLETNSQSCPNPYTSYVRALLAKVTLLGLPEKPAEIDPEFEKFAGDDTNGSCVESRRDDFVDRVAREFVDKIMRNAVGEIENVPAQILLCDEIDRTLKRVYQRHMDISPLSQWSTRWGKRLWDADYDPKNPFQVDTSSRSSSPDSFRSARSESRLVLNRPFDFLGHATSYGLTGYVLDRLAMRPKCLSKEYATYLLCCSVWALCCSINWLELKNFNRTKLDLVAELLRRGGNPNTYIGNFSTTIWGTFLSRAPWFDLSARKAFVATTKTFLENGADVDVRNQSIVEVEEPLEKIVPDKIIRVKSIDFHHEVSPLYLIRGWLEHTPELKELEEMFLARGGRDSHRYTHVGNPHSHQWFKFPERLQNKLIAALTAAHHGYENTKYTSPTCEWARKLRKIYWGVWVKDGDFEMHISSDETASIVDTEELHDSVTNQIAAELQDCQSIDE